MPATSPSSVLLPAPLLPITARLSPRSREKETCFNAKKGSSFWRVEKPRQMIAQQHLSGMPVKLFGDVVKLNDAHGVTR